MNELTKMLDERLAKEFENLDGLPEPEKSKAIANLEKLYKLRQDDLKFEAEAQDKAQKRMEEENKNAFEGRLKETEAKERWVDRAIRVGTVIVEIGVPLVFYGVWMNRGFKFEETGAFTSSTFKDLIRHFRPKK